MIWPLSWAGRARVVRVEQDGALVEERRLGRVEVLGRRVGVERAAAEGDDAALEVGDREHDAVAEAVVGDGDVVARRPACRRPTISARREAGLGEVLLERRPGVGRIAQAEAGDGVGGRARACRGSGAPPRRRPRASCASKKRPAASSSGIEPRALVLLLDLARARPWAAARRPPRPAARRPRESSGPRSASRT